MNRFFILLLALLTGLASLAEDFKTNYAARAYLSLNKPAMAPMADPNAKAKATENLQSSSLLFIENNGQVADQEGKLHPEILFTAKAAGAQVYVTGNSIHYVFTKVERETQKLKSGRPDQRDSIKSVSTHRFTLELVGANTKPELVKPEANPYYENYYLAHCPNGVVAHSYEKFTLKQVYPGVDWVVYSNGQGLKYDFVLAKGRDASKIKLKVKDADASLNAEGDLVMTTTLGKVIEDKPASFQQGQELETSFKLLGNQTFGFAIPNANNTTPLTIDPSVAWATYYGGSSDDRGYSCVTDAIGNCFLAGWTSSTNLPVAGASQGTYGGNNDGYLVKLNSTGSRLWATYYGGSVYDEGYFCSTDAAGNVYLAGYTQSTDFPVAGAFQGAFGGHTDGFLVKFNDTGIRLWATYFGGGEVEIGRTCATDFAGNVYLAGETNSTNLPVAGAFQATFGGGMYDAFIVKFNSAGSRLWASYYGGSNRDRGLSCTTDAAGDIFLVGETSSTDFPVAGAFQGTNADSSDAFIVKFNSLGSRLWATYYGGSRDDIGISCATDAAGNFYLGGDTNSSNFPVAGAFQGSFAGEVDVFIVKFSSLGSRLWATCYGGSSEDYGICASDAAGNVFLAGTTLSTDFPVVGAIQGTNAGRYDAFLVKFSSSGNPLWSTYYGGSHDEIVYSCATDAAGNVYFTGFSPSHDFPVAGAFQGTNAGSSDAFLVKIQDSTTTSLAGLVRNNELTLRPNPATTSVQLQLTTGTIKEVSIVDQLGRTVFTTILNGDLLDISSLAAGTYLVKVNTENGVAVQRMAVVR